MGNIFSGSEIVEMGIQIERNGKDFYETLVRQAKNAQAGKVFDFLAKEEEKHIAAFQKILGTMEEYQPPEAYPGEYTAYMNALASEYIFTQKNKGAEAARGIKSDKEALDKGIAFEKDSIIFYEGMKRSVPEYDIKVIDELIRQEQQHLVMLLGLKEKV